MCFIAGTQALRKLGVKFILLGTFNQSSFFNSTFSTFLLRLFSALSYALSAGATWFYIHEDSDNTISNVTFWTGVSSAILLTLLEFAIISSTTSIAQDDNDNAKEDDSSSQITSASTASNSQQEKTAPVAWEEVLVRKQEITRLFIILMLFFS